MVRIGIDLVIEGVPKKPGSHKASWLYMWASQLRAQGHDAKVIHDNESWDNYDYIYLWQNSLVEDFTVNVFGGISDKTVLKVKRLLEVDPSKLISLDVKMADYGKLIKSRLHNKSCSVLARELDLDRVSEICREIPVFTQKDLNTDWLIIGDSHSFSVYQPGAMVSRNDGKTLNGILTSGIQSEIDRFNPVKRLTLYFGNIDIRHHLCRLNDGDYRRNTDSLLSRYEEQLKELSEKYVVEVISALPIENESRIIPNSIGRYKGEPFYGSWSLRNECREYFNAALKEICNSLGVMYYEHPGSYINEAGELSFDVMEPKQNVHLSRQFYRWDLDNDIPRTFVETNSLF